MGKRLMFIFDGVTAIEMDRPRHVRSAPDSGGIKDIAAYPFRASSGHM
jgi:hypothetical protein